MKPGRPSPAPETLAHTRAEDHRRVRRHQRHFLWWSGPVFMVFFLLALSTLLFEQLTFTFSAKQFVTATVVELQYPARGNGRYLAVLDIQGRRVPVHPPIDSEKVKVHATLTVVCTRALLCRHPDPWSQNYMYVVLLIFPVMWLLGRCLLRDNSPKKT